MTAPTIAEELQRKHEDALVQLASDYDAGLISIASLVCATQAVSTTVSGLVDTAALTEMSRFVKNEPQSGSSQKRIFVNEKDGKIYVLAPQRFDLSLTLIELVGGKIKTTSALLESCVSPEIVEKRLRAVAEKLLRVGREL